MSEYTLPLKCRTTLSDFIEQHPKAVQVAAGTVVEIVHRAYTVFGSGGAWSRIEYCGEPEVLSSKDQGHNGFCGLYVTRLRLPAGSAVWALHSASIGSRRTFANIAFIGS